MLTKNNKTNNTSSFWWSALTTIGDFAEKHPIISLVTIMAIVGSTGAIVGAVGGAPILFSIGAVGVAATKNTKISKICPEFWQDPTNNCKELDVRKGLQSITHFPDGGAVIKNIYPLEEWACQEFGSNAQETASNDPYHDVRISCRNTGELECTCESHIRPRFASS